MTCLPVFSLVALLSSSAGSCVYAFSVFTPSIRSHIWYTHTNQIEFASSCILLPNLFHIKMNEQNNRVWVICAHQTCESYQTYHINYNPKWLTTNELKKQQTSNKISSNKSIKHFFLFILKFILFLYFGIWNIIVFIFSIW